VGNCPVGTYKNWSKHECRESHFRLLNLPMVYLVFAVICNCSVVLCSRIVSGMQDKSLHVTTAVGSMLDFGNRLGLFFNLWNSTSIISYIFTGVAILGTSFCGLTFMTLVFSPIVKQTCLGFGKSLLGRMINISTYVCGSGCALAATSKGFGTGQLC